MAIDYIKNIFLKISYISLSQFAGILDRYKIITTFLLIIFMLTLEWFNRSKEFGIQDLKLPKWNRYILYYFLSFLILIYFNSERSFIYFQF